MRYNDEEEFDRKAREVKKLQKMTTKQLQDELDRRLKEQLIDAIHGLPEEVKDIVNSAAHQIVCSYLGFRKDSWDRWELDSGSNAKEVSKQLGKLALDQVNMAMPDFVRDLLDDKVLFLPKMKKVAQARYKEIFYRTFNDRLEAVIQKQATTRAAELLAQLSKTPFEEILPQEEQDELEEAIVRATKEANKTDEERDEDEDE